jgi:hypothetical protein
VSGILLPVAVSSSSLVIWRADASTAVIPAGPSLGQLRGQRFLVTSAELRGSALILRQAKDRFGERQLMIHLFLKAGDSEAPGADGKMFLVRKATEADAPRVSMQWRTAKDSMPETLWVDHYSLRLEFGRSQAGRLPGEIYLCVSDPQKSFVAGHFTAVLAPGQDLPHPQASARTRRSCSPL